MRRWEQTEGGYKAIQSTKPQTLGYGLNDSPAGLAAWILEKWRSWADSGGDPMARLPRDSLLTMLTIYWATQTITPSMRDYLDNRWHGVAPGPTDFVQVPTAVAVFANHFIPEGDPPASGPNACTTSAGGPRCPAAATSLPQRSRTASPATSPPSSRRCEPNSHRVQAGNPAARHGLRAWAVHAATRRPATGPGGRPHAVAALAPALRRRRSALRTGHLRRRPPRHRRGSEADVRDG